VRLPTASTDSARLIRARNVAKGSTTARFRTAAQGPGPAAGSSQFPRIIEHGSGRTRDRISPEGAVSRDLRRCLPERHRGRLALQPRRLLPLCGAHRPIIEILGRWSREPRLDTERARAYRLRALLPKRSL
jgi:hypothetical protein